MCKVDLQRVSTLDIAAGTVTLLEEGKRELQQVSWQVAEAIEDNTECHVAFVSAAALSVHSAHIQPVRRTGPACPRPAYPVPVHPCIPVDFLWVGSTSSCQLVLGHSRNWYALGHSRKWYD